ncbi:MAG TPA: efflux RND transporter periplasmic adaptor subunit [Xanthobacteraceae bacterium]|nr:efflux RND transporter periplasmic adaptor subunit [Xanthobacteraceae bacterium]
MRWRRYLVYGVIAVALTAAVVSLVAPPAQEQRRAGGPGGRFRGGNTDLPVPTLATTARTANMPVYLDGVGTVRALNTVTVKSQVDGKLMRLNFREGQDVKAGEELAKIDPTIYQAQYDQAVAKKAQDEALLANAQRDLERYIRLAATNAAPPQQADTQRSLVAQYEAQIKADQGAIDNAKGMLDRTSIAAPISGRIGLRLVDVGNIINAGDATGLLVITQLQPISILFTLPQQQLQQVNKAFSKGPLTVEAFAADNRTVVDRGTLVVVDNQIDQATGTIRLKAEFPNPELQLWPGQFVNVRMLVDTLADVVVVPTVAIQRGPNGTFVYVVREDDTVAMRPVTVSLQTENLTVVPTGVQAGDRVITTSFTQLSDGRKVVIGTGEPGAVPTLPPAGAPNAQRRRGGAEGGAAQADPARRDGQRRSERETPTRTP